MGVFQLNQCNQNYVHQMICLFMFSVPFLVKYHCYLNFLKHSYKTESKENTTATEYEYEWTSSGEKSRGQKLNKSILNVKHCPILCLCFISEVRLIGKRNLMLIFQVEYISFSFHISLQIFIITHVNKKKKNTILPEI